MAQHASPASMDAHGPETVAARHVEVVEEEEDYQPEAAREGNTSAPARGRRVADATRRAPVLTRRHRHGVDAAPTGAGGGAPRASSSRVRPRSVTSSTSGASDVAQRVREMERESARVARQMRRFRELEGPMAPDQACAVMGVEEGAGPEAIRSRYLQLTRVLHPDRLRRSLRLSQATQIPVRFSTAWHAIVAAYDAIGGEGGEGRANRKRRGQHGSRSRANTPAAMLCDDPDADSASGAVEHRQTRPRKAGAGVRRKGKTGRCGSVRSDALVAHATATKGALGAYVGSQYMPARLVATATAMQEAHSSGAAHNSNIDRDPSRFSKGARIKRHERGERQRAGQRKRALRRLARHGFAFKMASRAKRMAASRQRAQPQRDSVKPAAAAPAASRPLAEAQRDGAEDEPMAASPPPQSGIDGQHHDGDSPGAGLAEI